MTDKKQKTERVRKYYKKCTGDSTTDLSVSLSTIGVKLLTVEHEVCFNVGVRPGNALSSKEEESLHWLLAETFAPDQTRGGTFLTGKGVVLEVGPRLAFCTAWSSNAVSICESCGLGQIDRIEYSRRYLISTEPQLDGLGIAAHASVLHDRSAHLENWKL
jgi:phosphoribosylformylglycinamidine synthase